MSYLSPVTSTAYTGFHSTSKSDDLEAQIAIVQFRYCRNVSIASEQDVHGNTALHNLASYNVVNHKLIGRLRLQYGGQHAWNSLPNRCGFTAQDLLASNIAAVKKPEGQ